MTSVMADESRVLEALEGEEELVAIAAINAPAQVVISGAGTAVAAVTARLEAAGVKAKALTVSHAFHSPLMKPMLAEYERVVREVRFASPRIPLVSGVTATICGDEVTRPEYWLRNVMDPVRFAAGMRSLEAAQVTAYLEVGPHPVLTGMGRQCVEDEAAATWLPSVKKDSDAWQTLLASGARLHVQGASFDWKAFDAPFHRKRVAVPGYAHGGRQFWLKSLKGPTPVSSAKTAAIPSNVAAPVAASGPSMYEVAWRKQAPAASVVETRHWVLLADRTGVAAQLERALRTEGARVTTAVVGPGFSESAGIFTLDPLDRDQVSQFVERVSARDQSALRFVYFWGLDANASTMPADRVLTGAAHLVQALAARQIAGRSLWVVTRDAVVVEVSAHTPPVSVDQAALWGFGRTVALEHPELWGGIVDIDGKDPAGLARELAGNGIEDQVALRSGNCYVPRLVRRRGPTASRRTFNAEGTYLVTGGTGALGLHLSEWLVGRGARRLVLASRRATLPPEARNRLQALEQRGVNITVFQADVSIAADVDALLAPIKTGPARLRGIVHAAGVDVPLGLDALDQQAIGDVLAAKLTGTRLLHERTRDLGLDLFIGVSSVSSVLGAQSRAHYAAANASLDAVLAERRRLGLPAVGVNWGPWKEGGMATDAHLQQFERIGNRGLAPRRAIEALDRLASEGSAQTTVIDIDWDRFGPVYESRRSRPLIAEAIQTGEENVQAAPAVTGWIDRLQRLPVSERRQELEALLQGEIAETLGFDSGAAVGLERNFYDLGMDSLLMADLVGRLKAHLGVPCSSLVFEHPHVTALSVALLERLTLDTLASAQPSASLPENGDPSYDTIGQLPVANRLEALTALLRQEVSAALGFDSPDAVREDQRFTDLGMDSLLSAELASRLKRLGVKSASVVFEYPTVDSLAAHLVQQLPTEENSVASETRAASPLPVDEILEFQQTAFPTRTESLVAPRWRWMFVASAERLGVQPRFWVHRDDGKIVAQMGSIPVRLKVGTDHLDTGWLVETMVREEYRKKAIGSRLMVEAHEEQPFSLSLGQTAEMREIQYRLGWKNVAPLQTAQALVRARNVLKAKLPSPLGWAAGATIDSSSALARRLRPRRRFAVRSIDRFDERHDRLWDRVAPEYTTAVVRDASYLNWKYVDQPGQDLMRLEFSDKGEVVAVAIWALREPDGIYGYRRALLYDLVTPLFNPALLRDVIANACVPALDAGADALVCLHISTRLTAALRACGFAIRQPTRHLLVDPGPLSGRTRDGVLASDAWFVTQGDSDIDRPW